MFLKIGIRRMQASFSKSLTLSILSLVFLTGFDFIQPHIVNGQKEIVGSPVAQNTVLIIGKFLRSSYTCTGVVLTDDLILTAAHCLGPLMNSSIEVFFKTDKKSKGAGFKVVRTLAMISTLPPSSQKTDWDDLALLKIAGKVPANYKPVKFLENESLLQNGREVILAGYGTTTVRPTRILQSEPGVGQLRSVSQTVFQFPYGSREFLINLKNGGACRGDSGGPAFVKVGTEIFLIGIASRLTDNNVDDVDSRGRFKYACTQQLVYTNVLRQKQWVESAMAKLSL